MEAIRPGSAVNLRGAAPQPHMDLTMSWPRAGGGFPQQQQQQQQQQQLPYTLVPVQQQPLPPQRPQQPSLPQQQPQPQPAVTQLPPRQLSQHSMHLRNLPVESEREPQPYMQPGEVTMSTPPPAVPPVVPSRSSSGPLKHAHTFPEMDTDDSGYLKIEPSTVPIPRTKSVSQPVTSNPEKSTPPATPTTTTDPAAHVDAVVGIMKNMSTDQMQMLVQMLSKLNPGAKAENSSMQPPQLCKTQSTHHVVSVM